MNEDEEVNLNNENEIELNSNNGSATEKKTIYNKRNENNSEKK